MGEASHKIRVARTVIAAIVLVALFAPASRGIACGSEEGSVSTLKTLLFILYLTGLMTLGGAWLLAGAVVVSWVVVLIRPGLRVAVPAYRVSLLLLCPPVVIGLVRYCSRHPDRNPLETTWGWPLFQLAVLLAVAVEVAIWLLSRCRHDPPEPQVRSAGRLPRLWTSWVLLTALATGAGAAALHQFGFMEAQAGSGAAYYSGLARDGRYNAPQRADIVLDGEERGATAALGAVGAVVGLLQCSLVLGRVRRADLRILGGLIGYLLVLGHPRDVTGFLIPLVVCCFLALAVGGVLVGFRQRRWGLRMVHAALWVLAGPAVLVVALGAHELLTATALREINPAVLGLAVWGAALGLVYGAITGTATVIALRLRKCS